MNRRLFCMICLLGLWVIIRVLIPIVVHTETVSKTHKSTPEHYFHRTTQKRKWNTFSEIEVEASDRFFWHFAKVIGGWRNFCSRLWLCQKLSWGEIDFLGSYGRDRSRPWIDGPTPIVRSLKWSPQKKILSVINLEVKSLDLERKIQKCWKW